MASSLIRSGNAEDARVSRIDCFNAEGPRMVVIDPVSDVLALPMRGLTDGNAS